MVDFYNPGRSPRPLVTLKNLAAGRSWSGAEPFTSLGVTHIERGLVLQLTVETEP